MSLSPGTRLGVYEVTALIGQGGMGQVYRATDRTLGRQVAIKILPDAFASDPGRLARFEREAQTLASLNHPHIAAIYAVEESAGLHALVMELVEGEDLSQLIARGSIPIDEAVPIAKQIAEALEAAHEQGIIHRDLKPANIKVRADGTVKVLDFGLAKATEAASGASINLSHSPTTTLPAMMTGIGVLLGTAPYMSPEQARGKAADKRSDVWAFGCVVYEMLTGKRAFEGEDVSDTLAAVLRGEPDWDALATAAPPAIRVVIKRCLEKNRRERIPDISVVRFMLDEPIAVALSPRAITATSAIRSAMLWKAATALFVLTTLGALAAWRYSARSAIPEVTRFLVFPSERNAFWAPGRLGYTSVIVSPDGRRLAFTAAGPGGRTVLWVRAINSLTAEPLAGTEEAAHPFWSPDSRFIAYSTPGKLMKIDVSGGPPLTVCAFIGPNVVGRGGTWNRKGVIVFNNGPGPLYQVSSTGGQPSPLMQSPPEQSSQVFPSFLPDGRHVVFYAEAGLPEATGLHMVSLDTGESKKLLGSDSSGIYDSVNRFLLFVREGTLLAQGFDPNKGILSGEAFPIAERVESGVIPGVVTFSISETGTLAYGLAKDFGPGLQMVWLDRQGKQTETFGSRANYRGIDLAPDSRRVAAHRHDGSGGDIWVSDPSGRTTRLTFDASQDNASPIWSPDGHRIVYSSIRSGKWGLYQRPSDNTGTEGRLLESDTVVAPVSWSPDGNSIVYEVTNPKTQADLWVLPLSGDQQPFPVVSLPLQQSHGQISPDGKWLAYESFETGRMEVFVQPFPSGAGKHLISAEGGAWPRWRSDGHELFYVKQLPDGNKMMAVAVRLTGSTLAAETPKELFDSGYINLFHGDGARYHPYSVSADGQHFLIPRPASSDALDATAAPMVVVLNWAEAAKK